MRIRITTLLFACFCLTSGCSVSSASHENFSAYKGKQASVIYQEAKDELAQGNYHSATERFEAIQTLYPYSATARKALLNLIYTHYKADEKAEALLDAARYIHLYPQDRWIDYVYFMTGIIHFDRYRGWLHQRMHLDPAKRDLRYFEKSFNGFNQVCRFYPKSKYRAAARQYIIYIRNLLARHELDVANFYYQRHAYVAAANRASEVIQHYPNSPHILPALTIMHSAYKQLGLTKLASDTERLIKVNR